METHQEKDEVAMAASVEALRQRLDAKTQKQYKKEQKKLLKNKPDYNEEVYKD